MDYSKSRRQWRHMRYRVWKLHALPGLYNCLNCLRLTSCRGFWYRRYAAVTEGVRHRLRVTPSVSCSFSPGNLYTSCGSSPGRGSSAGTPRAPPGRRHRVPCAGRRASGSPPMSHSERGRLCQEEPMPVGKVERHISLPERLAGRDDVEHCQLRTCSG